MSPLDPSDVRRLAALWALLHERSVTRAAARVGVSVPAMSRTLTTLRAVASMTWALMPWATRVCRRWLYPPM